jgi:hypothetical protein
MITTLEEGLKNLSGRGAHSGESSASSSLGDGEIRRRKDLLINARKEKDGLEDLLHAMATKSKLDRAVASMQDKDALLRVGNDSLSEGRRTPTRSGRVLGKETERTRELDNNGVLQLQRQMMQSQDQNVDELMKIIIRQRELGTAIHEELEVQNELLKLADEDTDRFVVLLSFPLVILTNRDLDLKPNSMSARSASARSRNSWSRCEGIYLIFFSLGMIYVAGYLHSHFHLSVYVAELS